jgi:hypothetical protein
VRHPPTPEADRSLVPPPGLRELVFIAAGQLADQFVERIS